MLNSALGAAQLRRWAPLGAMARRGLERWAGEAKLSARAFHRAWRVARTLADLDDAAEVEERHVMEALGYRLVDQAA
jgi:magnesium chelatase family protein